jgi:acyl-ACP thioesterase
MEYYYKDYEVDVHNIDYNGVCKASALMRYIQSTAQSQLTDNGLSYDQLKEKNKAFILSRIKLEFTKPVRAYDKIKGITFPCPSRGYSFLRCYQIVKDDEVICRGASVWALVDTDTRSLVKVNDFDLGLRTFDPLDYPLTRIPMPKELTEVGKYRVSYGMLDQNKHMNNTKYPDMVCDFLPDPLGTRIVGLTLSYHHEAAYGDTLTVFRADAGNGTYYFRTHHGDTLCLEAMVKTENV